MLTEFHYLAPDLESTQRLGQRLGALLFPGAVIGLEGPLGAGKTCFVRAVAEGLGIEDPRLVTSPTFILVQEYPARWPMHHVDVYRLRSPQEFIDLGAEEWLGGAGVCLIEWADRIRDVLPEDRLDVVIDVSGAQQRSFHAAAHGPRHGQLLADWARSMQP